MHHEKLILLAGCNFQNLYEQRNAPNLGEIIKRPDGVLPSIIPGDAPLILLPCQARNAKK